MSHTSMHFQKGIATLSITVVLLIVSTISLSIMYEAVTNESQVAANEYRSIMAFEAAQSGLGKGILEYRANQALRNSSNPGSGNLASGESYSFWGVSASERSILIAEGISDDGSVTRRVQMDITYAKLDLPKVPVVAGGGSEFSGNFEVINKNGNLTIWSGGSIELNGSFSTYVPHPTISTASIQSSSKTYRGSDLVENDPSLSSLSDAQFQRAFLGATVADFCSGQNVIDQSESIDFKADLQAAGSIICVKNSSGDVTFPTDTFISGDESRTIIVNGNLDQSNKNEFNGLLFVSGDVKKLNGTNDFYGSLIVGGYVDMGNGGPTITFEDGYTQNLGDKSTAGSRFGSWRDW